MSNRFQKLEDFLFRYVALNDAEWFLAKQLIKTKEYKKGEIIQFAGDVCDKLIHINSGIVRSYILDEKGNDYTWEICFNNENAEICNVFVIDYDSFLTKTQVFFLWKL